MIEEGLKFSTEELQEAFAQVLAEADDNQTVVNRTPGVPLIT